ncbi:LacI family DNA-binding transcriptional regulator [Staphylococcus canis]|uniref:LacI family transcriptional regulator n=1 Tax=Staphylococcus canis TaxID=2724942 RepID=A0ABS0T7V8_9STAP|nr:LacI family DNA-binding transcriptional regulator [Staphylococcus canis]MBI5974846.1 LacI family transcriptional regulator [Staphylococcus canis]
MVSVKDVAKLANVSTATVSRVLSNTGRVKAHNRQRVLDAAEALGYHPNNLGRQLRKMETMTILVVVPDITNSYFSEILRNIENIARSNGYEVILGDTQNKEADLYFSYLYEKKVDGMIVLTSYLDVQNLEKLSEQYPIVLACEKIENSHVASVSIDNIEGAAVMTRHLIQKGHTRIGHVAGPMDGLLGQYRAKGFRQEMGAHGLNVNESWIFEGDYSLESGIKIGEALMNLDEKPTALFVSNDEMAIGIMKVLKKYGLHVPEDMALVGFDNIILSDIVDPGLTTFAQPTTQIGQLAMEKLLKLLKGEKIEETSTLLEGYLLERQST